MGKLWRYNKCRERGGGETELCRICRKFVQLSHSSLSFITAFIYILGKGESKKTITLAKLVLTFD